MAFFHPTWLARLSPMGRLCLLLVDQIIPSAYGSPKNRVVELNQKDVDYHLNFQYSPLFQPNFSHPC
jgi:hypothetical protein